MNLEIKTEHKQQWKYETDPKKGVCLIAKDEMEIVFVFEQTGDGFYDVLKIDAFIDSCLKVPVTVEGMADKLHESFPKMKVTARGRAVSHGWITSTVNSN